MSSRKTATNENINTYGGSGQGRDYTSLVSWEADTDIDLVSAAQSEVLECYDDEVSFDDRVNLMGATTNASYFRILRPASGERHDGTPNNGFNLLYDANDDIIRIAEDYSQVQDIIVSYDVDTSSNLECFKIDNGNTDGKIIGCIVDAPQNSGSGEFRSFESQADTGEEHFVINCLGIGGGSTRENFEKNQSGAAYFYNCNSIDSDDHGFENDGGTMVCKNCLSTGSFDDDFHDGITGNNNASGDATAPGTNNRINQTFTFVNAAADDYHLASNDAGARDYGADLSADSDFAFDDDIDFEVRPGGSAWDIGFDEYIPPTTTTIPLTTTTTTLLVTTTTTVLTTTTTSTSTTTTILVTTTTTAPPQAYQIVSDRGSQSKIFGEHIVR